MRMRVLAGLLLLLGTSSGAAQERHGFWFTGGLGRRFKFARVAAHAGKGSATRTAT